jgi:hypothetical protein
MSDPIFALRCWLVGAAGLFALSFLMTRFT